MDNCCCGRPKSSWASPKGMRGKCERRRGSANDGAEVQTRTGRVRKSSRAMGARRGRLSAPWLQFHGGGAADVYIIIRVRASGCGESALNPPTSQHIPRRRSAPAPAQRRALPEHFFTPSPPRRTPADPTTHFPPKTCSRPRTATRTARAFSHSLPAPTHTRRLRDAFLADLTTHSSPKICSRPRTATRPTRPDAHQQAARCIPRRPHHPFPAKSLRPPPHSDTPYPGIFSLPSHALPLPRPATMHTRRPHDPFPAEDLRPSPQRRPASPSVPLRAQKNGTAQWMCDAECLGRPSLRSVIGVGEPRAVRRRCGALAWRVGLRPQPWALRSRRCGRVLRA